MSKQLYAGNGIQYKSPKKVTGNYVRIDGDKYYCINNFDEMPPFFMSIVSAYEHWMFLSSNGALTAGRKNREHSLFPYYTVDKIHDSVDITGGKTLIIMDKADKQYLWEPFSVHLKAFYNIQRNIYKNAYGTKVIFEEINNDLGLVFRYSWTSTDRYGFVRTSEIRNNSSEEAQINILDGVQNILPYGVNSDLQTNYSNLVDAYKKNELLAESGIGIYYLSSIPTDRAEPSEGLKSTVVWSQGIEAQNYLLSSRQLDKFRSGGSVETETDVKAARGAYFIQAQFVLAADDTKQWYILADVDMDLAGIAKINYDLKKYNNLPKLIEREINSDTEKLKAMVARADGLQLSNDELSNSRHFSNTLFNIMRGGVLRDSRLIEINDFKKHLKKSNTKVANLEADFLDSLPDFITHDELLLRIKKSGDADLRRLFYEYLPILFSRRHGDPSRPWNLFNINLKDESGNDRNYYEGNWRDIFQNWEALGSSFPQYLENMIARFVNASTADGYNPYRITSDGFDWETIEPDNPWSNIGYWGDHQIIYLLKLLELSVNNNPQNLKELLTEDVFAYANVPYRIKKYNDILENPQDTILFDDDLDAKIKLKTNELGTDAQLLLTNEGRVYRVNLAEKIFVTLLAKLTNFIPEAGIWLNTQRPEWNDANNALVGNGVSMVTLYHIRRYLNFLEKLLTGVKIESVSFSKELFQLLDSIDQILNDNQKILIRSFKPSERKAFTDAMNLAGETYRELVYAGYSVVKVRVTVSKLKSFVKVAQTYMEHTIRANKRDDNLYHAYNLIKIDTHKNTIDISYLYEMLEGQVAVLNSGFLSIDESVKLLDALKNSALFRADQYSYLLYPDRKLPDFVDKNNIPKKFINKSELAKILLKNENQQLFVKDVDKKYHFNGTIRNALELKTVLDNLKQTQWADLVGAEEQNILDLWESMFNHSAFTGRSGTFFGYEGLGSIYWHMVSKLLISVAEMYYRAVHEKSPKVLVARIAEHYYEIRAGIGLNKAPDLYGAFPTDAYSHTPAHAGAQQPGMTGQVKEDILSRFAELGVTVHNGQMIFEPLLLRKSEFLDRKQTFEYFDLDERKHKIKLETDMLAFTYCQVPVVYHQADYKQIVCKYADGKTGVVNNNVLDVDNSRHIFGRTGEIVRLDVYLDAGLE